MTSVSPDSIQPATTGTAGYPEASDATAELAPIVADDDVVFVKYKDENDMICLIELIEKDLSEPYSIFTYRYFINNWPQLCFLANSRSTGKCLGGIVCKLDMHRSRNTYRGYIAMLAVDKSLRGKGIGRKLVKFSLDKMQEMDADECVLETEEDNKAAIALYKNMGFVKEKRLHKYYLNGSDAFRLKFLFKLPEGFKEGHGCLGRLVSPEEELALQQQRQQGQQQKEDQEGDTRDGVEVQAPQDSEDVKMADQ